VLYGAPDGGGWQKDVLSKWRRICGWLHKLLRLHVSHLIFSSRLVSQLHKKVNWFHLDSKSKTG